MPAGGLTYVLTQGPPPNVELVCYMFLRVAVVGWVVALEWALINAEKK